jgi:hypothetical protein
MVKSKEIERNSEGIKIFRKKEIRIGKREAMRRTQGG